MFAHMKALPTTWVSVYSLYPVQLNLLLLSSFHPLERRILTKHRGLQKKNCEYIKINTHHFVVKL